MKLINPYSGITLLETVEHELRNSSAGGRFDVGVGFALKLTGTTLKRFGTALDSWLIADDSRTFRLFIGDNRFGNDKPDQRTEKIDACTRVAAELSKFTSRTSERMEVVYVPKLHAKFYSMWHPVSNGRDLLRWAIVGSSNLTDAALEEKNIELDVYLETGDSQLISIQKTLRHFIREATDELSLQPPEELQKRMDGLTRRARKHYGKERAVNEQYAETQAERDAEECRDEEERARRESDDRQGIYGGRSN